MNIENYNVALELIQEHESLSDFVGKGIEELIKLAHRILNVKFFSQYYNFLRDYGAVPLWLLSILTYKTYVNI